MFEIKFKIKPIKELNKEIENSILEVVDNLKKKLEAQKRQIECQTTKEKKAIVFEVTSNGLSATDFLVQLDKQVREKLGKEYKTTIEEIEVNSYLVEAELEEEPKTEFSIPFVKKLTFNKKKVILEYDALSFTNLKDQYVEKSLKLIKDKIKQQNYAGKEEFRDIVWEGKKEK